MEKWNGRQLWDMPILFDSTIYFCRADDVADVAGRVRVLLQRALWGSWTQGDIRIAEKLVSELGEIAGEKKKGKRNE